MLPSPIFRALLADWFGLAREEEVARREGRELRGRVMGVTISDVPDFDAVTAEQGGDPNNTLPPLLLGETQQYKTPPNTIFPHSHPPAVFYTHSEAAFLRRNSSRCVRPLSQPEETRSCRRMLTHPACPSPHPPALPHSTDRLPDDGHPFLGQCLAHPDLSLARAHPVRIVNRMGSAPHRQTTWFGFPPLGVLLHPLDRRARGPPSTDEQFVQAPQEQLACVQLALQAGS